MSGISQGQPSDSLKTRALEVHARLCAEYHCPIPYFHSLDPLSELVSSLLSHRTKNRDSGRAFRSLRERFPTWELVKDAPVTEIEAAIAAATWPEQKAPRIKAILSEIAARHGSLTLDFLADWPEKEARGWLEELKGVGPKTSAAVLSFSTLRRPSLAVDCHHHRVAQRLNLIGKNVAVGPSHDILRAQLPGDWSGQAIYDNHEVLMLHGQRVCFFQNPACHRCKLLDLCPTGMELHPELRPGVPAASAHLPGSEQNERAAS
jgi:endonuclease-3